MQRLMDRAVVVTGAGRGLGRAYAIDIARQGGLVVVNDIDAQQADHVVNEIVSSGGTAVANHESVASWHGAAGIVDHCLKRFGRIDGLVNNAGIMPIGLPWEQDDSDIRTAVDVNLVGAIHCGVHALRAMVEQGSGAIVNVTSGAQMGRALMSTYGATRAGTAALTYGWAIDGQPHGVRVNAIWPGATTQISATYRKTDAAQRRGPRPDIPPESAAPLVTYLLSDLSKHLNGQVVALRGKLLGIVSHPILTDHHIHRDSYWDLDAIAEAFATELDAGVQDVGTTH